METSASKPRSRQHDVVLYAVMAGMAVTASAALVTWDRTTTSLQHDALADGHVTLPAFLAVAVGGWTLMVVAMMMPTSAPLFNHFAVVVQRRPDASRLLALLVVGYLAVWVAFGVIAHLGDLRVHSLSHAVGIDDRPWLVLAATLALAGGYQFTGLKYRCLRACRSPRHFILTHWHGRRPAADALRLGVDHGIFCLGCCWTLMLLMFAVAWASVPVMLVLGAVMATEKNGLVGDWLTPVLGYGLLGGAAAVVATGLI